MVKKQFTFTKTPFITLDVLFFRAESFDDQA